MTKRLLTVVSGMVMFVAVVGARPASAQPRWGSETIPNEGICFYRDINLKGNYFCARVGESLSTLPGSMGNEISSIRIIGKAEAMVFSDARFRGGSAHFETDVRDLRREGWNDRILSLQIRRTSSGWANNRGPVWGSSAAISEGACFYKEQNFRGQSFCVPRGASYALVPPGFNDKIASIRVMGSNVMLFKDRDFSGKSTRLRGDVHDLSGSWKDTISSIRVY